MLYQLNYEASLEADQERVQFIPVILKRMTCVYDRNHIFELRIKNTSESDLRSCLSSCKESPETIRMLQRDFNPWPLWYRCDALPTELWSLAGSRSSVSSIYTGYMKRMIWCVYDRNHIVYALQIKYTGKSDPRSSFIRFNISGYLELHLLLV